MNETGKKKGARAGRGGEGEEWADARARTNTRAESLCSCCAASLSSRGGKQWRCGDHQKAAQKVHKTNFINPIAAVTNTEAEYIYSTKKENMSSYPEDEISAGKTLFTVWLHHPSNLTAVWHLCLLNPLVLSIIKDTSDVTFLWT